MEEPMVNLDGGFIKGEDGNGQSLRDVCIRAMVTPLPEDQKLTATQIGERWSFILRLNRGENEISLAECTLLCERIPKIFQIVVAGQALALINGGANGSV